LVLLALYPLVRRGNVKDYAVQWTKQMIAWAFLFFVFLLISKTGRLPGRLAASFGGLALLALLVFQRTSEGGIVAGNVLSRLAEILTTDSGVTQSSADAAAAERRNARNFFNNWPADPFRSNSGASNQGNGSAPA
jgi:hypothetical protein